MKYLLLIAFSIAFFVQSQAQGTLLEKEIESESQTRTYKLYIPESYDGTIDYPLVINYHAFNGTSNQQMVITGMNEIADTARFLVAYPQALEVFNPAFNVTGFGWNVVQFLDTTYSDTRFTELMIEDIQAAYAVDSMRIHATGFSFGSEMALSLICELPNVVASVAGVAESLADFVRVTCDPQRPFSMMTIHGTDDNLIPFEGGGGFWSAAIETPAHFAKLNNCDELPIITELEDINVADNSTVTLHEYTNCDANTEVLFYQINDGGHAWPGSGENAGINNDINASAEIWNFFQRNPRVLLSGTKRVVHPTNSLIDLHSNMLINELRVNAKSDEIINYQLVNLNGKVYQNGSFRQELYLNIQELPVGLYILVCRASDRIQTEKLVKMN